MLKGVTVNDFLCLMSKYFTWLGQKMKIIKYLRKQWQTQGKGQFTAFAKNHSKWSKSWQWYFLWFHNFLTGYKPGSCYYWACAQCCISIHDTIYTKMPESNHSLYII